MGYRTERVEMPISAGQIREFDYALLYGISSVQLTRTEALNEIDWTECQEARFFSEDRELHVFEDEEGKRAVLVADDGDGDRLVKQIGRAHV